MCQHDISCVNVCETHYRRLVPWPLPFTPHKYLHLLSDHRAYSVRWCNKKFWSTKNHSNNSKCHSILRKEKKKSTSFLLFFFFFFFFIVKFNNSRIVISNNWFFKKEIPVNMRDNNSLLLYLLLDTLFHVVALVGLIAFSQSWTNDSWKILPKYVDTKKKN